MSDRWALSSKTVCPLCGERIKRGRDSYGSHPQTFEPCHFRCLYKPGQSEMATTNGGQEVGE